jgi:hypothetical protein
VARQGQRQVIGGDALAIVQHPQELDPTLLQVDLDALRPGVQAILDQLLGHRGRTLDHLPGSDLIDQVRRQGQDSVAHHQMGAKSPAGGKQRERGTETPEGGRSAVPS